MFENRISRIEVDGNQLFFHMKNGASPYLRLNLAEKVDQEESRRIAKSSMSNKFGLDITEDNIAEQIQCFEVVYTSDELTSICVHGETQVRFKLGVENEFGEKVTSKDISFDDGEALIGVKYNLKTVNGNKHVVGLGFIFARV